MPLRHCRQISTKFNQVVIVVFLWEGASTSCNTRMAPALGGRVVRRQVLNTKQGKMRWQSQILVITCKLNSKSRLSMGLVKLVRVEFCYDGATLASSNQYLPTYFPFYFNLWSLRSFTLLLRSFATTFLWDCSFASFFSRVSRYHAVNADIQYGIVEILKFTKNKTQFFASWKLFIGVRNSSVQQLYWFPALSRSQRWNAPNE